MRAIAGCALFVLALVGAPALATPASAQSTTVTSADIQRLQDRSPTSIANLAAAHDRPAARQPAAERARRAARRGRVPAREAAPRADAVARPNTPRCATSWTICAAACGDLVAMRATRRGRRLDRRPPVRGAPVGYQRSRHEPRSSTADRDRRSRRRRTTGASVIPVGQELDVRLQDTLSSTGTRSKIGSRRPRSSTSRWTAAC